ncbi:tyrosine-type recombinase/integrase [Alicyclobacillus ferrooxydans]|uniref:tyrosine-type recombinase/integrase n=1 Tax=Alicyclobacillus ferrooxydans TaxID=471514 RepID=UPI0006D53B12|nr:tyrosine-type recombinase/integrase [Alicyclobacillus ferrooxydans]
MQYEDEFAQWLLSEGRHRKTVQVYQCTVRKFGEWWEQQSGQVFQPQDVTALDLHDWCSYMRTVQKYAQSTINRHVAGLKTYWGFLHETERVHTDPTRKVRTKRPSILNEAPRWLTRKEQAKFLHQIEKEKNKSKRKRDIAMVQCMLQAGCRAAEVTGLDLTDFDAQHRTLKIRNGKRGKMRIVPVNGDLGDSLMEWLQVRKHIDVSNAALFLSERQQRITVRALQHMVSKAFAAIGIEGGCHSFRHSFCKNLLDSGQSLNVVAQLAGHESVETTLRYLRPSESDLYRAVQQISWSRQTTLIHP